MGNYEVTPPPDRLADRVQMRTAFSTDRGDVIRFVSQLEYWLLDGRRVVVRYDHDTIRSGGHDVSREGLHREVYRDGRKVRTERITGPIPAEAAFDFAEDHLRQNAESYVRRFEDWHDVTPREDR